MKKQGAIFGATLLVTGAAVVALVARGIPVAALGAGIAGVLLHWVLSRSRESDAELADSSYFFGFILTLVFLAAGLYSLGALSGAPNGADPARGTTLVLRFLEHLAAGLVLTIVGLVVRQVRAFGVNDRGARDSPASDALTTAQQELAVAMRTLVLTLRNRPEEVAAQELSEVRSRAKDAVERLDQSVAAAAERMVGATDKLERAIETATSTMLRAGSGLGDSLAQTTQRIAVEVTHVLSAVEGQRTASSEALHAAQSASAAIRADAEAQVRMHLDEWRALLEHARASLAESHKTLDEEYKRGLAGFSRSGVAFAELADRAAKDVEALPNPSERLVGLWDGVRTLEGTLADAIGGSVNELRTLRERADTLSKALTALAQSTESAASHISAGGTKLGDALQRELRQMNTIIEEYASLVEQSAGMTETRR